MDLPLHPKIVHLPIALAVLMPLLTGGVLLAIWRSWLPQRAFALVFAGQLLLVGSGVLAMRSGEADEERVERVVPETALEAHEEAAERFIWSGGVLLGLMLLPLLLRNPRTRLAVGTATFAGTLVVLGLGYQVGQKGGELVYGHNAGAAFVGAGNAGGTGAAPATRDGDEDD